MKTVLKYSLPVLALALFMNQSAKADPWSWGSGWGDGWSPNPNPNAAPEVDPSLALSGLALLGGTLTVLRSRRRK
jgi:LPXTG-motif cell wall-anchored protein